MFSFKSFSSNIANNYQISPHPSFISGPWKVYDAKKKNTGNPVSVFIFDRKSLEIGASGLSLRSSGPSLKKLHEEAIERLKREAANLARLRHPSILQIIEPVEDTRNGGLMFATEPVTSSLSRLLQDKDDQENSSRVGGRPSRFMVEAPDGSRRRVDLEIDELEIQKGLLQIAKGLEFLHESANLVHGNMSPDAVFINSKSDWKLSSLSFAGPTDAGTTSPLPPLSLSEILHHDPRLPRSVQLDLDYCSPDFVIDSYVSPAADLFSLGLIIIALYNSPHVSPLHTNNSISTYKKLLGSASTIPSQSNSFLCSRPLPKDLTTHVLPRLITRQRVQRLNAKEFQESPYFDNILVSTIRFLESFPTKTPNEKAQFLRGLPRVIPDFPHSVLERKVLEVLLEQTKDRELLSLVLKNVFGILKILPSGRRVIREKLLPQLKEMYHPNSKTATQERDTSRDGGLMIVLENIDTFVENCTGKDFKDDVIPLIHLGLESPTHSLVDISLKCLPTILPVLDFSTVKNDIFPAIASVFSKTSSLAIKIRGLEAFSILCGGSAQDMASDDDLSGIMNDSQTAKSNPTPTLDKYTVQEKVVPLLKAIKTKEPAVMMAALKVFRQAGRLADSEFIALEILPALWAFALGPLLNVQQFSSFMEIIKSFSSKIESERMKSLQEMASTNNPISLAPRAATSQTGIPSGIGDSTNGSDKSDFESLVLGRSKEQTPSIDPWGSGLGTPLTATKPSNTSQFSWSSSGNAARLGNGPGIINSSRSITPDMAINSFPTLQPDHKNPASTPSMPSLQALAPQLQPRNSMGSGFQQQTATQFSSSTTPPFSLPAGAAPGTKWQPNTTISPFSIAPPPSTRMQPLQQTTPKPTIPLGGVNPPPARTPNPQQKQGLDKYESLL
ncbi:hypothetical protein FQN57_000297 [Myotisia sp. PD_48]|nr:hypothetical protein FQN57_000297 [Myotisia sp. PD_48]